jgi:hypothetical protein
MRVLFLLSFYMSTTLGLYAEPLPVIVTTREAETQPWWSSIEQQLESKAPYIHMQLGQGPLGLLRRSREPLIKKLRHHPILLVDYATALSHVEPNALYHPLDRQLDEHARQLRGIADDLCQRLPELDISLWYYDPRYQLIPIPH